MSQLVPIQPNAVAAPLMRFQCSVCLGEVCLHQGSYEDALILLRGIGWRVANTLICPGCLQKQKRQFREEFL